MGYIAGAARDCTNTAFPSSSGRAVSRTLSARVMISQCKAMKTRQSHDAISHQHHLGSSRRITMVRARLQAAGNMLMGEQERR